MSTKPKPCLGLRVELLEDRITPDVYGFDSRIPIPPDQLKNPVNDLGAIQIFPAVGLITRDRNFNQQFDQGDYGLATAFLIGPNYALTSAHVVGVVALTSGRLDRES